MIRKIHQIHPSHPQMNFSFSHSPFLLACSPAQKWNGLATKVNALQSFRFSEEMRFSGA
jgi:hypothetical protein